MYLISFRDMAREQRKEKMRIRLNHTQFKRVIIPDGIVSLTKSVYYAKNHYKQI